MTYEYKKLREYTAEQLIEIENSLDYRDPDVIGEILRRAEIYIDGITQEYESACSEGDPLLSEIFEKAINAIK